MSYLPVFSATQFIITNIQIQYKISGNRWVDEENVVYMHYGVSAIKHQNPVFSNTIDETGNYYS